MFAVLFRQKIRRRGDRGPQMETKCMHAGLNKIAETSPIGINCDPTVS